MWTWPNAITTVTTYVESVIASGSETWKESNVIFAQRVQICGGVQRQHRSYSTQTELEMSRTHIETKINKIVTRRALIVCRNNTVCRRNVDRKTTWKWTILRELTKIDISYFAKRIARHARVWEACSELDGKLAQRCSRSAASIIWSLFNTTIVPFTPLVKQSSSCARARVIVKNTIHQ